DCSKPPSRLTALSLLSTCPQADVLVLGGLSSASACCFLSLSLPCYAVSSCCFPMSSNFSTTATPNCCTSTHCPQFWGVWRREAGSARRSEGGGNYSREGTEGGRPRDGHWSHRTEHKPTHGRGSG